MLTVQVPRFVSLFLDDLLREVDSQQGAGPGDTLTQAGATWFIGLYLRDYCNSMYCRAVNDWRVVKDYPTV
jgi:hypothetical protein